MTVFGYYGHAAAGIVIGAALLAHGYFYQNERSKTVGIAALIVLAVVSAINETVKTACSYSGPITLPGARVRPSAWPPCSLLAFLSRVRSFLAWQF